MFFTNLYKNLLMSCSIAYSCFSFQKSCVHSCADCVEIWLRSFEVPFCLLSFFRVSFIRRSEALQAESEKVWPTAQQQMARKGGLQLPEYQEHHARQ